jgi:predicted PurR-regulated permease PerM
MTTARRTSTAATIALCVIATVALLWWLRAASQLLIPIALGVCISYALEPVVAWMARAIPRLAAASLLMLTLLGLSAWGVYSLRDDAEKALEALPDAARRVREMVTSRQQSGAASNIKEASSELQGIASGQDKPAQAAAQPPASGGSGLLQRGIGSIFALSGHLMVIVFLVFFLLVAGDHFTRRLIEISGTDERRALTAKIMRDINAQIQRFLLVRLVTGGIVAVATWAALAMLGTPQAAVWGILAGVFNSIPYFGPVIVSGGLFLVGLVQSGDAMQGIKMAGAALVITSIEGWLLTPPLIGKAERMSALVVFLGLLLWTWIWGAWGTILAVPMLVVIKSVADHVDVLKPMGRLMAP